LSVTGMYEGLGFFLGGGGWQLLSACGKLLLCVTAVVVTFSFWSWACYTRTDAFYVR